MDLLNILVEFVLEFLSLLAVSQDLGREFISCLQSSGNFARPDKYFDGLRWIESYLDCRDAAS